MNGAKAAKRTPRYLIVAIGLFIAAPVYFFGMAFAIIACEPEQDELAVRIMGGLAIVGGPGLLVLGGVVLVAGALRDELASGLDDLASRPLGETWEVERADGSTRRFTVVGALLREILSGAIRPDAKARKITSSEGGKEPIAADWRAAGKALASYSFHLRAAISPIWAHSVKGAQIGSQVGIIVWLALGVYSCLIVEWFGVAYWLSLVAILWTRTLTWGKARKLADSLLMYVVGGSVLVAVKLNDFMPMWQSLPMALGWQFGATVAGALVGVLPGVALGTLVGIWREPRVARSPYAKPERKTLMFLKWVLLPGTLFCAIVPALVFFSDWAAPLVEHWLEIGQSVTS